jgi:hypothetical protein
MSFHTGQYVTFHRADKTYPAVVLGISPHGYMTCRVDAPEGPQVYPFQLTGERCIGVEFGRVTAVDAPQATELRAELAETARRCREASCPDDRLRLQYRRCELTKAIRQEERR